MDVMRASRRRAVVVVFALVGALALLILSFRSAPVPDVILLPANTSFAPKGPTLDRWVPMSWAWYWRAKDFMLGHSKTVVIHATFISVPPRPEQLASFPPPMKTATNLNVYFVSEYESARMNKQLASGGSYTTACRISTAHGIQTKLFSGQSRSPEFSLEVLAKRRGDYTDLQTCIKAVGFGDAIGSAATNLAMAARLQIPKDHVLFIVKTAERAEEPATLGVILTPKWK